MERRNSSRLTVFLRVITLAVTVTAGVVIFTERPQQSQATTALSSLSAAPQQNETLSVELGHGFSAAVDGAATVITTPCPSGSLFNSEFPMATTAIDVHSPRIGALTASAYRFDKPADGSDDDVTSTVYRFVCAADDGPVVGSPSRRDATNCLALVRQDGAIKPKSVACPISTWVVGGNMYRPELQLATKLGAQRLTDGIRGTVGLGGCEFGDRVTLSLDGQTLSSRAASGTGPADTVAFVLPALQHGVHQVTANCTYSEANKPAVARPGGCISVVIADDTISTLEDCSASYTPSISSGSLFEYRRDDSTLRGACGGFGFTAFTTTAAGTVTGVVAVSSPGSGDQAHIGTPAVDPIGYLVASCWTDIDRTRSEPLRCYHVALYPGPLQLDGKPATFLDKPNPSAACPFKTVVTAATW